MTNRFDTSQEHQYVSSYVPLPFQTIAALGEKANKNFAEGKQAEAELGALGQAIKAAPMYEGHRQSFINEYNTKTKALVDEAKGDYGSKDFQLKAQNLVNEFKSRPEINSFANTLKSYNDWEAQKKDPKNAMNLDFTYDMDPSGKSFRQRDVLKEGVYSPKFTQFEDYTERAKKIMGDVKDSGYVKELGLDFNKPVRINNGETEVYSNKEQGYVGVTKGRVGELSNMLAQNYAQTEAGKHHLQSLLGANITYGELSNAAQHGDEQSLQTLQAVNKEFANHIFRSNANQIGGHSTDKVNYMDVTNRKVAGENDASNFGKIITTNEQGNPETMDLESTFEGLGLKGIFDDKGGLKTNSPLDSKYTATKVNGETKTFDNSVDAHKFAGSTGVISQQRVGASKSASDVVHNAYSKLVPIAQKLGLEVKDGKYAEAMYNYGLAVAKRRSTTSNLQPNTQENLTENFLGKNSNFHNMEIYEQGNENSNAKLTNEQAGMLSGNSRITGIDYFGNNQSGWKIAATPKDDKGNTAGIDQALIAIPRDKKFEEETRPIYNISKGALEFAKTGEVNSKYKDRNYDNLQNYVNKHVSGTPKLSGSSTEYDSNGNEIIRGSFVQTINGEPQMFGVEMYPGQAPIITTLDNIQNKKTEELQLKGSLNQYVNKLQETTKPSNAR